MYGIPFYKKNSPFEKYWNYLKTLHPSIDDKKQVLEMNALHWSIFSGNLTCVQEILKRKSSTATPSSSSVTSRESKRLESQITNHYQSIQMNPLFLATIQQNHSIVQYLIHHMYNHKSNHTDVNGINPILLCSMFHGDIKTVSVLLSSHCNINQIDKRNGNTCLHYAIENGYTKMIHTICEMKKNTEELSVLINHANAQTKITPYQLASQKNLSTMEELLKQYGAMEYRTYSEILKEGWLFKEGHIVKSWKQRWFVLKNTCLSYYKSNQALKKCSGMIQLKGAVMENIPDEWSPKRPFCFSIHDMINDKKYYIVANDEKEKKEWMTMLEYAIQ